MSQRKGARGIPLSRERVAEAALRLIDRDGLEWLSMRRLGAELGVDAMMVYRFFANKAAVLDGVMGTIWAGVRIPEPESGTDWRDQLVATMHALRTSLLAHPRALPVIGTRPASGTATFDLMEQLLTRLIAAGLPVRAQTADLLNALVNYTVGHVLAEAGEPAGGDTEEQADLQVLLARYPHLASVFAAGWTYDPHRQFDTALRAMVAGWAEGGTP
ncbi:TetR/AcrR family transcriptional regulator [Brevibacterium sp. 50QC2O2]|uniref:TetR/AcrR family transcriptional regulator n=1 Tax=Brevibacterium TaxID=1696 RepID=UPI00211BE338|nr:MULTISPECIES: TetR/AcrR family transcriptional regulator [unclassified Brevibacterium]MCQ9385636.1 TetR/AcrR family transcriptional regulator [Brevibacterium sp. 68QC2CO]MCQ9389539.1 TetR/AcrR family transcriptional regulator [Brevibacterium sp. 50QC2O2]